MTSPAPSPHPDSPTGDESPLDRIVAFDKRWNLFDLLLIAAAPLLLYLINSSWTFVSPSSWVDPWLYTSYFFDLGENIEAYGFTYYVSRLPWILFGHAAYSVLPSEAANLFIRFVLVYGAVFSTYSIVWNLWRRRAAATIAALVVCTNTAFLWSVSWNYVDGPAIVLMLCSLACLTRAATGKAWAPWSFAGGAFALMAMSTNIILVIAVALLATWLAGFTWLNKRCRVPEVAKPLALMAAGGAVAFVAFGLVNLYLGGSFNYLAPQIEAARIIDASAYSSPPLAEGGFLAFPLLAAAASLSLIARLGVLYKKDGRLPSLDMQMAALAGAHLLAMGGIWIFLQVFRDMRLLNHFYYANFLLPFAFIAIGGVIAVTEDKTSRLQAWRFPLTVAVLLALVAPFLLEPMRVLPGCPEKCLDSPATAFVIVALAVLLVVLVWDRSLAYAAVAVLLVSVLNTGLNERRAMQFDRDRLEIQRNLALMRFDADKVIRDLDHGNDTFYWLNSNEPYAQVLIEVASLGMWNFRLISQDFPAHPAKFRPGMRVVIGSHDDRATVLARANEGLAPDNQHAVFETEAAVRRDRWAFNLFFIKIADGPAQASPR